MQLDRTEIAIRGRSTWELLDLSLLVIRRYWKPLMASSALLGLPLLGLNVVLIAWMLGAPGQDTFGELEQPAMAAQYRYLLHLTALWFLVYPLASLPATLWIGKRIFFQELGYRQVLKELKPIAGRAILVLGVLRAGALGLILELFITRDQPFDPFMEVFVLPMLCCGWAAFRRATAPYAPEILALEACSLKARRKLELSYWRRSSGLHSPILGHSIARFIACALVVCALVWLLCSATLVGDFVGIRQTKIDFLNSMLSNQTLLSLVLPLMMWLASIYATVFRFLTYLDARIGLEGWEVELQLKAERDRVLAQMNTTHEAQLRAWEVPAQ